MRTMRVQPAVNYRYGTRRSSAAEFIVASLLFATAAWPIGPIFPKFRLVPVIQRTIDSESASHNIFHIAFCSRSM